MERNGLGNQGFEVAELHHRREPAKLMVDLVREDPDSVTVLTLGPLTNVARACELAPNFCELAAGLVCLAGSVTVGGDASATSEFNVFSDPHSARMVLRSPAAKTLVPLDVSRRCSLDFAQLQTPRTDSELWTTLQSMLQFSYRAHHQHLGEEGIGLKEVAALASVSRPDLFQRMAMAVDVETTGELTRGMTVFDQRGVEQWQTNIDVLTSVDQSGLMDHVDQLMKRVWLHS